MADNKQKKEHDVTTTTSGWQKQHTDGTQTTELGAQHQKTEGEQRQHTQWSPEAEQAANDAADRAYKAYGYKRNPETGALEKDPSLFDALGIDREKLRGERERQMKLNRWKQIESALYNSGAIISDMITAGIGGNVYKRDKDTTAKDAAAETDRLRELQAAEDAAAAEKERQERQNAYKAGEEAQAREYERLKEVVSTSNSEVNTDPVTNKVTSTSDTKTTSGQTQHQDYSQKYWDNHSKSSRTSGGSGSGGGSSKSNNTLNIRVKRGANGNEILQFDMNASDKTALANSLSQAIAKRCATDENYRKELQQAGIIEQKTEGSGRSVETTWSVKDPVALLDDGNALEIPELMNIYLDYVAPNITNNSRSKAYETITGANLVRDATTGKVTQAQAQALAQKGIVLPASEIHTTQQSGGYDPDKTTPEGGM